MCRYTCGSIGCVLARERACYLSCALAHVCRCLHFCVHVSVWLPAYSPARPLCLHFCVHVSVWLPACSPARLTNARAVRYRLLAASAPSAPACPEPRQYMRQCVHETVQCYCSSLCPQCICLLGALNMRQCGATAAAYALNASALLGALKGIRPGPVFNPTGMGLVPIRQARDSAGAYSNPGQKIMPGAWHRFGWSSRHHERARQVGGSCMGSATCGALGLPARWSNCEDPRVEIPILPPTAMYGRHSRQSNLNIVKSWIVPLLEKSTGAREHAAKLL